MPLKSRFVCSDIVRCDAAWTTRETVERHQGGRASPWGGGTPRFASPRFADRPFAVDDIEPFHRAAGRDGRIDRLDRTGIVAERAG